MNATNYSSSEVCGIIPRKTCHQAICSISIYRNGPSAIRSSGGSSTARSKGEEHPRASTLNTRPSPGTPFHDICTASSPRTIIHHPSGTQHICVSFCVWLQRALSSTSHQTQPSYPRTVTPTYPTPCRFASINFDVSVDISLKTSTHERKTQGQAG